MRSDSPYEVVLSDYITAVARKRLREFGIDDFALAGQRINSYEQFLAILDVLKTSETSAGTTVSELSESVEAGSHPEAAPLSIGGNEASKRDAFENIRGTPESSSGSDVNRDALEKNPMPLVSEIDNRPMRESEQEEPAGTHIGSSSLDVRARKRGTHTEQSLPARQQELAQAIAGKVRARRVFLIVIVLAVLSAITMLAGDKPRQWFYQLLEISNENADPEKGTKTEK